MTTSHFPDYIKFLEYVDLRRGNDETLDALGKVAAHWQDFGAYLTKLGQDEIEHLQLDIRRLLQENGVTYNVYGEVHSGVGGEVNGEPNGHQRLWALDLMPLIISEEEWRTIEAGVVQRAELLNLILTDLYGPQTLIKEQLLPLELVYQDPGFLRSTFENQLPGKHQLILYAVDLARGPDRRMWVVGDRTQAPSGSGYALENRTIMNQVQQTLFRKDTFRNGRISRLSGYFRDLQSTLAHLAPRQSDSPRVVVMTPGPHSETYFEHAYLSSYLGYTLVQGADLSVFNGTVNLKALSGLQPIDTILRRVDDTFCDPLELRSDSHLGVPGLLESVRRGQVTVVNPLGSGVLENLGITPFLQNIARDRLGEDLILPMAATWWCGQPKELAYVLEHLDELVIKPVSGHFREPTIVGHQLTKAEQKQLAYKIEAQPHRYVGQQQVSYSTAPTFISGELKARHTILRSFALAREDDYTVMPGGLTRSATAADAQAISASQGGVSKDTWVLTKEPQQHVSLWKLQAEQIVEAFHSSESLPSRAAENLFWVGRYIERAESSVRLFRTILAYFTSGSYLHDEHERAALHQLLCALTQVTMTYPGFVGDAENEQAEDGSQADELKRQRLQQPTQELLSVALDPQRIGGLHADLLAMFGAANAVRNLWSIDIWRVMQDIEGSWTSLAERTLAKGLAQMTGQGQSQAQSQIHSPGFAKEQVQSQKTSSDLGSLPAELSRELNRLMTRLMALAGLYNDSMTHNAGWTMLDMGRRLERALRTISLIRSVLVIQQEPVVEHLLLESTLQTTDNSITYRRRYRSHLQIQTVLDLLLLDEANPRSLLWQLNTLKCHLETLPRTKVPYRLSREEQIVVLATTQLQLCHTQQLIQTEKDSVLRQPLDTLMADLTFNLSELSTVVTQSYFTHTQVQQQFGTARVELLA
ncbi:MAG: circularly permuted type 2 ATP-grasp protein [Chloroflexota bacterium]